ncbi:hypothetical protein [Rhodoplanes roseus]|uniref:Uncharacterized protein n=1 Tax=Rhodoplanes roseus TaxID=29409 RepID=A0A327KTY4_9BRAD|nr:hypothetical protein [Rhodoplanes roseus]RAI40782.1 hypothetical protein CH341_23075 [Rhodoplanes roseus]
MAVVLILLGILLLLPGLCAGAFVVAFGLNEARTLADPELILLWLICFAVMAAGILTIRAGLRRSRAGRTAAGRHGGDMPT